MDDQEIEEIVKMIDNKMTDGISRLSVGFAENQERDYVKEQISMGKRDSWDPWVWVEGHGVRDQDESF